MATTMFPRHLHRINVQIKDRIRVRFNKDRIEMHVETIQFDFEQVRITLVGYRPIKRVKHGK